MSLCKRPPKSDLIAAMRANPKASYHQLGEQFGASRVSIRNYMIHYRLHEPVHSISKEDLQLALDERPGITQVELAKLFSVAEVTMREHLEWYDLKTARKAKKDRQLVEQLFAEGHETPSQMAKALGVHRETAKNWMYEFGLSKRAKIRGLHPPCAACDDPVDPAEPIWGGIDALHFTCADWMLKQAPRIP